MAGDWIKFEENTPDKPEVYGMAAELGIDPDAVVGKLLRVWSWASRNCPASGRTDVRAIPAIDRVANIPGFARAMQSAGWLTVEADCVTFPNFDRHSSQTAKERALDQRRKRESRRNASGECPAVNRTEPGLEKRREEKSKNTNTLTPLQGDGGAPEETLPGIDTGSQTPPSPSTNTEQKPRERNPLFDALASVTDGAPEKLTQPTSRAVGVALAQIRKASPDVTAAEIARRAANYPTHFRDATLTASALAKHWARCESSLSASAGTPVDPLRGPDGPNGDLYNRF